MSTRSNIGILNADKTVTYIYCHFDGYLGHNGKILSEHYTTEEKVRELIGLGDLSCLGEEIGEKQDFDQYPRVNKTWCLAYGRDRGESNTEAKTIDYFEYTKGDLEEYIYLFTNEFGWEVRENGSGYWADLNKALKTMII